MNKGNFTAKDNFPVSTFTYDFLQNQSHLAGDLAKLGGLNYILSGCTDDGNGNISVGRIVINGEILPFEAGTKKAKISIQETMDTDHFNGVDYPESYVHRVAKFADNGEYNWSDFVQVLTNKQLEEKIESIRSENPGFVKMWSGVINRLDETKYLLCDGRTVNTADYPDLAYFYGKEGENSFKLPDLRKQFIVGYDGTAGSDYGEIGNTGGEERHVLTLDESPKHNHIYTDDINARNGFPNIESGFPALYDATTSQTSASSSGTGAAFYTTSVGGKSDGSTSAHENRPPFYVLAFVVRVNY